MGSGRSPVVYSVCFLFYYCLMSCSTLKNNNEEKCMPLKKIVYRAGEDEGVEVIHRKATQPSKAFIDWYQGAGGGTQ